MAAVPAWLQFKQQRYSLIELMRPKASSRAQMVNVQLSREQHKNQAFSKDAFRFSGHLSLYCHSAKIACQISPSDDGMLVRSTTKTLSGWPNWRVPK